MRRHDALIPLSHDHHLALRHARMLRQAAEGDDSERVRAAEAFIARFFSEAVRHFREEEEEILPLVIRHPDAPRDQIAQMLEEHVLLHALVRELRDQVEDGSTASELMREIASTMRAHVRLEEDRLFPAIERSIGARLDDVHLAQRQR